jgi:hypothetical protein
VLLRVEGVSFQVIKTYKQSKDPDFVAKKNRVLELCEIADGKPNRRRATPASSSAWINSARATSIRSLAGQKLRPDQGLLNSFLDVRGVCPVRSQRTISGKH